MCSDNIVPNLLACTGEYPLASSLHKFKSSALTEAYDDLELTPVGVGYLEDIPALKDQMISFPEKIPIIQKYKSGNYYLRKLSRTERKNYIKAFVKGNYRRIPLRDWMASNFEDLEEFINTGFTWDDSEQGQEYWDGLATRSRWMISPSHMDFLDKINLSKF